MAFSKPQALLLVAVALAATAMTAAAQGGCRKVTVQNLCGHDLALGIQPLANSQPLYSPGYLLRHGTHAEFPVCSTWTGRVSAPGSAIAEFHMGGRDGGAWYQVSQQSGDVRVSVTPHGHLLGHCPTSGCMNGGRCFAHTVPGGDCRGVDEIKIIFYSL